MTNAEDTATFSTAQTRVEEESSTSSSSASSTTVESPSPLSPELQAQSLQPHHPQPQQHTTITFDPSISVPSSSSAITTSCNTHPHHPEPLLRRRGSTALALGLSTSTTAAAAVVAPFGNSLPSAAATSTQPALGGGAMSGLSLPSFGNAAASSSLMPLNDFSTMLPDETTDSAGPTPIPTPLGSPRAELQKLSLGMERYARAVEDPAVMGGSFSGTVPLPSLSQSHPPIARQGSTASSSAAAAAAAAMMAMKDRQGGGSGGPLSPSSTVNASTGINLHTLKRAISGKFVGSGSSGAHSGLPHHHAPQSVNDLEAAFDIAERRDSHNAEAVMLEGLGYAPQPILLPAVSATRQQQEAAGDEDVKGSARANTATTTTTNTAAAATFTPVSRSRAPTAASSSVSKGRHMMAMQEVPDSQIRRRKTKGGILSQLLKLQRQEAAAVAAARAAAAATAATSSSSGHSRKRDTARPGGSGVKKSKMGFHYRGSSSKNNSVVDLVSGSVTTTPRVSPRNSTLFESIGPEETMTRLPTQPSTSINAASSPFSRLSRHNSVATHHHHTMEEMEAISAAATAARNLGIHHDIADILGRQSFLILMAKALILYGAPSHRIEETCSRLARKLEVDASFALLPGLMTISFSDPETHTSDTRHLRCTQGMDMYKLSKVYQIALGVLRGDGMEKANKALEAVTTEAGYYPVWVTVMAWMGSSAFVAPLAFKGSWIDCGLAALCGLLVGVLGLVAAKFPIYGNVFEITSSIVVGFIARALGDHVCFSAVALAGVVVLLPGLLLTQAIMELASRNIVSGAVRMFYALMYAFFLGFGLSIGAELWEFITHPSPISDAACEHGVNHWWYWLIFPGVSISINIVFNAHPSQWLGMTLVTAVGFCVSYFMPSSSPQITSAIAAFAVGIAGQAYGRLTGQLSYVPLLSGVLLLVPGSVGVRGTLAFFGSNPSQGFEFALTMINVAMGITLGVFCSALVWYPFWRKATFMNF